jgi:hypothetical protein
VIGCLALTATARASSTQSLGKVQSSPSAVFKAVFLEEALASSFSSIVLCTNVGVRGGNAATNGAGTLVGLLANDFSDLAFTEAFPAVLRCSEIAVAFLYS